MSRPAAGGARPGRFIVIEGLDGAGISTQARRLAAWLDERGVAYASAREPTDGPIGSQIRQALAGRLRLEPETLALLYAADRHDHIHAALLPRLRAGVTVVSERHVLSSLAYQGSQLGDLDWVRSINRYNLAAVTPDLTVFLDLPPETALERIDARRHARELFERPDTLARARVAFQAAIEVLRADGARIESVDATLPIPAVSARIAELVEPLLGTARPAAI